MLLIVFEYLFESLELSIIHCLDDKLRIMGKEEETSTLSLRLSSFLDFFDILVGVQ